MNTGDEENSQERDVPLPFQKISKTRLGKRNVLLNIFVYLEELLCYLSTCEAKLFINAKYRCREIIEMLEDWMNYAYLCLPLLLSKNLNQ